MRLLSRLLLTSSILLCCHAAYSQTSLRGTVFSNEGEKKQQPLSYAGIALYASSDTAHLVKGTLSDKNGNFVIENVNTGRYVIKVTFMGYRSLTDTLAVGQSKTTLYRRYVLEEYAHSLSNVVVTGSRSFNMNDRKVELFSPMQIKTSHDGLDLIAKTPRLYYDPLSKSLKDVSGSSLVILLNGIAATDDELRAIPKDKILRVEYYDNPPVRYAESGRLINVITKRLDDGHAGGFDLSHALTTGFANDKLFYTFVRGNSKFDLLYGLNWRKYSGSKEKQLYEFSLEDAYYRYARDDEGKFNYAVNDIGLNYTYNNPDKFSFVLKFSPSSSILHRSYHSAYDILEDSLESLRFGLKKEHSNTFSPMLSAYTNVKFTPESQIYLDLVGTLYNTKQDNTSNQYADEAFSQIVLENFLYNRTHKKSFIGELMYELLLRHHNSLTLGVKSSFDRTTADIRNILNGQNTYHYNTQSSEQTFYTQYTQTIGSFYASVSARGNYRFIKNDESKYHKFEFMPIVTFNYHFDEHHFLRFKYSRTQESPSISMMSKSASRIMDNIIAYGNPEIKPNSFSSYLLTYCFDSKHLFLSFSPFYRRTNDVIAQYYGTSQYEGKTVIAYKWENAKYLKEEGFSSNYEIYPLKDRSLCISGNLGYWYSIYQSNYMPKFKHSFWDCQFIVSYSKEKYGGQLLYRIVDRAFLAPYTSLMENHSSLTAYRNIGNWRLSLGWMFWFTPSKYDKNIQTGSFVNDQWKMSNKANRNMITVGISWNFNTGKSIKVNKKLENKDTDSGVIEL